MTTTPTQEPAAKRGRPGYDRQTLVDMCVKVFNRHGYDATSMGMLATELGISKSAIYHHVKTKEEILQSALTEALGDRKSTRLNSSHVAISYAVFSLKKKIQIT